MELFHRRYLCFFAFLFIFASFVATLISGAIQLIAGAVAAVLAICALLIAVFNKKLRFAFAAAFAALVFVFIALVNSFLFITVPTKEAQKYAGSTEAVKLRMLSEEYSSDESSEYTVRIEQIDADEVDIKAQLYCDFPSELSYGDTVLAIANIELPNFIDKDDRDKLLSLTADSEKLILYKDETQPNYFSPDGVKYIFGKVRTAFGEYVDAVFGEENGALIRGFLINDTSDVPSHVISDFRRSGTLHLLAVSGLHIAVLMGMVELLLRKMLVPKKLRCAVIAIISVLFLGLTAFSASAVRSVLMLFAVYAVYMFSEDGDGVTALFVSIFLIILFSPFSVYDLGMWMSFFATLGLLTVYPFLEGKIPKPTVKNKPLGILLNLLSWIAKTVLLTVVANVFLLPVMWYFFGEISVSAIPANLLLSPIATVYMPLCAVSVILGAIPVINTGLAFVMDFFGDLILYIADLFANVRGAVLSLNYRFVPPLIIIFIAAFSILLVIRLKQKLWICVPPTVFCLLFAVCLTVFGLTSEASVKYVNDENKDYLFFEQASSSTVCDIGSGGYSAVSNFIENVNPYSTEIENYILTHCHSGHIYSVEKVLMNFSVRKLYLPLSEEKDELLIVSDIYRLARKYDTEVIFYESGEAIKLFDDITLRPYFERISGHPSVFVTAEYDDGVFTYADASETAEAVSAGAKSRYFLLGTHGETLAADGEKEIPQNTKLIFATEERRACSSVRCEENKFYIIAPQNDQIKLILPLE